MHWSQTAQHCNGIPAGFTPTSHMRRKISPSRSKRRDEPFPTAKSKPRSKPSPKRSTFTCCSTACRNSFPTAKQRVALGRAMVREPNVPLPGRADPPSRRQIAPLYAPGVQGTRSRNPHPSSVYVTHDYLEALSLTALQSSKRASSCRSACLTKFSPRQPRSLSPPFWASQASI